MIYLIKFFFFLISIFFVCFLTNYILTNYRNTENIIERIWDEHVEGGHPLRKRKNCSRSQGSRNKEHKDS